MALTVDVGGVKGAPWRSHPMRSMMRVELLESDANGLSRDEEFAALSDLEDRLDAILDRELDAWFVGRFTWKGSRALVYYHPEHEPRGPVNLAEIGAPYVVTGGLAEDPDWSFLLDTLAPTEREQWTSRNRHLQHTLKEKGDRLDRPRLVDHVAIFDSEQSALAATGSSRGLGFDITPPHRSTDGIVLGFRRRDTLHGARPDEFVNEILDALEPHAARYDGWGAPIT